MGYSRVTEREGGGGGGGGPWQYSTLMGLAEVEDVASQSRTCSVSNYVWLAKHMCMYT